MLVCVCVCVCVCVSVISHVPGERLAPATAPAAAAAAPWHASGSFLRAPLSDQDNAGGRYMDTQTNTRRSSRISSQFPAHTCVCTQRKSMGRSHAGWIITQKRILHTSGETKHKGKKVATLTFYKNSKAILRIFSQLELSAVSLRKRKWL